MLVSRFKFHAWADRQLKDKFLVELGGQAYDLLQLWKDQILTNGFWTRLWDEELPLQEVAAARETAEEPEEPISPGTTAGLLLPRED